MGIQLDDLKDSMEFVAWQDRALGGYCKLLDESLLYEIARRARLNQDRGRPWTSIEVLPDLCVTVQPQIDPETAVTGEAVRNGRTCTEFIRKYVPFGPYAWLRQILGMNRGQR